MEKGRVVSSTSSRDSSDANGSCTDGRSSKSTVSVVETRRSLVPLEWESSVRVLGLAECREAALSLAHAFAADDFAKYLCDVDDNDDDDNDNDLPANRWRRRRTPEQTWRLHVDMMTYLVAAHCYDGLVMTIGPEHDSVALWLPPGKGRDGWLTLFRSGLWRLYFQLSAEGKKRYFEEMMPLLHDTKAAVLGHRDHEAYYLDYLGTRPSARGRGYGQKLLEHMLQRADAENRPVYLESSSLANNAYYMKHGFEVRRDIFLKRGQSPVRLSIMVREPKPPPSSSSSQDGGHIVPS